MHLPTPVTELYTVCSTRLLLLMPESYEIEGLEEDPICCAVGCSRMPSAIRNPHEEGNVADRNALGFVQPDRDHPAPGLSDRPWIPAEKITGVDCRNMTDLNHTNQHQSLMNQKP